jgi:hypothetical protein
VSTTGSRSTAATEAVDHPVDAPGERCHVGRIDRGIQRDAQLVAAELAIGLDIDDPVGAQYPGDRRRVDLGGQVDGRDDGRPVARIGDEGRRVRGVLRPAVDGRCRLRRAGRRPRQATSGEHRLGLLDEQEQGGDRGGVQRLVLARLADGHREVEGLRDETVRRSDPLGALDPRRGQQRQPQPAVGGERLLRREVVDVGLRGVQRQPARARGPVDDHERTVVGPRHPRHLDGHPGRGLVVGPRVDIDAVLGHARGGGARVGPADGRRTEPRRPRGHRRELRRELPEGRVLGPVLDQAERGEIPEQGRAPVAEGDLVPVGELEEGRQGLADALDE